jgi:hypothetical protein
VLAYDSGSSAKLIRLLGVDRPELDAEADTDAAARTLSTLLTISGMLSVVGEDILEDEVEAEIAEDTEGVVVKAREISTLREGVPGMEEEDWLFEFFIALCLGGKGACVEDECVPFVNNLEIDAVAVDVPASGTGAGVRGMNLGGFSLPPLRDAVT